MLPPVPVEQLAVKPQVTAEQLAVKPIDFYELEKINDYYNRDFRLPNGRPLADCEWFTTFKGNKLREMGYQPQNVYVATETQGPDLDEPNHVVLRMGDWILDNRFPRPYKYKAMLKKYREYPGWTTLKARK